MRRLYRTRAGSCERRPYPHVWIRGEDALHIEGCGLIPPRALTAEKSGQQVRGAETVLLGLLSIGGAGRANQRLELAPGVVTGEAAEQKLSRRRLLSCQVSGRAGVLPSAGGCCVMLEGARELRRAGNCRDGGDDD